MRPARKNRSPIINKSQNSNSDLDFEMAIKADRIDVEIKKKERSNPQDC